MTCTFECYLQSSLLHRQGNRLAIMKSFHLGSLMKINNVLFPLCLKNHSDPSLNSIQQDAAPAMSLQQYPTPCDPMDDSPGTLAVGFSRQEYWTGCQGLLQGIFQTQGSKSHCLCLLNWQIGSLSLSYQESPIQQDMAGLM